MRLTLHPLVLSGLACPALTACSRQESTPSSPAAGSSASMVTSGTITIGYSDWPGWTAWDIAHKQGFFKKHNVHVTRSSEFFAIRNQVSDRLPAEGRAVVEAEIAVGQGQR